MVPIKLFGLQRTGTNYITNLLKNNFGDEVIFDPTGWKHGHYCSYTYPASQEPNIIVVSKNPYAWMTSCYKYWRELDGLGPDLTNMSFEEFVTMTPVFLEGSSDVPFLIRAASLMDYYNNMYYHWLSIRFKRDDRKICLIRYEDALLNVDKTLDDIATIFNLNKKDYTNIENEVIWGHDGSKKDTPTDEYISNKIKKFEKKNHYLQEEYMDSFNDDMLKFVARSWDDWLMSSDRLGYKLKKASVFEKIKMPPIA